MIYPAIRPCAAWMFLMLVATGEFLSAAEKAVDEGRIANDEAAPLLAGTQPFGDETDVSKQMVEGIHRFLDRELEEAIVHRERYWNRDFSSSDAYDRSVAANRERLREILGAVDSRVTVSELEIVTRSGALAKTTTSESYSIHNVRWPVFEGVHGEGLLLVPKGEIVANVVAVPDADQTPEDLCGLSRKLNSEGRFGKRLAEQGCRVLVPVLLSRDTTYSGNAVLNRWTNLSHREWIWRMSFEVGRTPIGYEVQKILSAVDYFASLGLDDSRPGQSSSLPIGVAGYGEGGRVALFSAALDVRIQSAWVSGYFDSRQGTWAEPGDRAIWSLLKEFGDAEIASLVAPRALVVEFNEGPIVQGDRPAQAGQRPIAAPGQLAAAEFKSVVAEIQRAKQLMGPFQSKLQLVHGEASRSIGPGAEASMIPFLQSLGVDRRRLPSSDVLSIDEPSEFDPRERQRRTVTELADFTQERVIDCERTRADQFWNRIQATNPGDWEQEKQIYRTKFDEEVIGKWDRARLPLNPRSRPALDTNGQPLATGDASFTAWDVKLDVMPDVFAWGVLLLPKDVEDLNAPRPVVVCQHGLEGLPEQCMTTDTSSRSWKVYKAFATRLAERGFIVFIPHNPYRGGDEFRRIQRKSWLLGRHLFSIIHAQHASILDWLETLSLVDAKRIAFYGLSYGGKSAMRIPAVHDRYCLSICSGDFNEWVRKNAATDYPSGYLYTAEYEIFEWNLGHTFNYAEMAGLIAPRPFMVEHGFQDRVATPEWASYEYAKVRRFYARLGIDDRTAYEFFDGPHTIHGQGTFEFLHRHLQWPLR